MTADLPTGSGYRALRRRLRAVLPGAVLADEHAPSLEVSLSSAEPLRTTPCQPVEDDRLRARHVSGDAAPVFGAFLDGTQDSRTAQYCRGVPLVYGRVAAVVRARRARRLSTWRTARVEDRLYAPLALLTDEERAALDSCNVPVVDTLAARPAEGPFHPGVLQQYAVADALRAREALERGLADAWCATESVPLYADGPLPRGEVARTSRCCVGVVKSHQTLYADGDALELVCSLGVRERTSVMRLTPSWGPPVASWYLRLRHRSGTGPLWGLVRVEVALTPDLDADGGLTRRADEVSRWILAERAPLALPDDRWDRMVYGVRDCEEYLRAVAL